MRWEPAPPQVGRIDGRRGEAGSYLKFASKNVTFGTMYFTKYDPISRSMGINLTLMGGMGINLKLTDLRHRHSLNLNLTG